jgi:hypothetical protein
MTLVKSPTTPNTRRPVLAEVPHSGSSIWQQTRIRLVLGGVIIALCALLAGGIVANAYSTAYTLFQTIAEFYAIKVDAAEGALQDIARTSQATADYTALSSDTPLFEAAVNDIFRNFNAYRGELFTLQSNLQSQAERTAFTVADTYTYSRFWRHVSNLIDGRSDLDLARREYLSADNHLRNRIIPALEALEAENFSLMATAGEQAGGTLGGQTLLVALSAGGLLVLLAMVSFWLRGKVRRYITPGIDGAMALSALVLVVMLVGLFQLPSQFSRMTQMAYYNISSSSRALVAGNLANRAESSAVIDVARAQTWYEQFDASVNEMERHLCGVQDCLQQSFLTSTGQPNTTLIDQARRGTTLEEQPLIASVQTPEEIQALETARVAFLDYLGVHDQLVGYLDAGQLDEAVTLNTGFEEGESEALYATFTQNIERVQQINRETFNTIWDAQRTTLPAQQVLYGVLAFGAIIVLTGFGVSHRFREL